MIPCFDFPTPVRLLFEIIVSNPHIYTAIYTIPKNENAGGTSAVAGRPI